MTKKQNGKLRFTRGPRACGSDGIRASRLLRNAGGRDCGHCTQDRRFAQTLREWVKRAEKGSGMRDGVTTEEHVRIKAPEREVRKLCLANEILRNAYAYLRWNSTAR